MFKKLLTASAVLAMIGAANATITMSHELWASGFLNDGVTAYESYRVSVHVAGNDDWTACGVTTWHPLVGATFFQVPPPFGGDGPPDPAFFIFEPDLPYDTFYGDPRGWPNDIGGGTGSFAAGRNDTPTTLEADWFDLLNTGDGDFVIMQFTVLPGAGGYTPAWLHFEYAAANSLGTLFAYDIPEPTGLALFALAGLVVARRR